MKDIDRLFDNLDASDHALAQEVAARIGMDLPTTCVPGVAANARLLQRHADIFRGRPHD